jgi:hypothetical protein
LFLWLYNHRSTQKKLYPVSHSRTTPHPPVPHPTSFHQLILIQSQIMIIWSSFCELSLFSPCYFLLGDSLFSSLPSIFFYTPSCLPISSSLSTVFLVTALHQLYLSTVLVSMYSFPFVLSLPIPCHKNLPPHPPLHSSLSIPFLHFLSTSSAFFFIFLSFSYPIFFFPSPPLPSSHPPHPSLSVTLTLRDPALSYFRYSFPPPALPSLPFPKRGM